MDDDLRAKPTPDQNPLLGRKINTLYQLLTTRQIQRVQQPVKPAEANTSLESKNGLSIPQTEANSTPQISNDDKQMVDDNLEEKMPSSPPKSFFENASMRLTLPIPVDATQRLLMINIGDDFTHIWFPTWHKFLSAKRIQSTILLAKNYGTAIEMSQSDNNPKVFVTNSHRNSIFIGPYAKNDKQNLALFVKHENHMMLSETYHHKFGIKYLQKTKGKRKT